MLSIKRCALPDNALLVKYRQSEHYCDCYQTQISGSISHADFINAFYTTTLFKLERSILTWTVSRPSTDAQALQLANGKIDSFAAWHVEARADGQILLVDFSGRTRSWLMAIADQQQAKPTTQLYFGSAVTSVPTKAAGGFLRWLAFFLLIRLHKLYSISLLLAARSRLKRTY